LTLNRSLAALEQGVEVCFGTSEVCPGYFSRITSIILLMQILHFLSWGLVAYNQDAPQVLTPLPCRPCLSSGTPPNSPAFSTSDGSRSLFSIVEDDWLLDLTTQGIEPNPGPGAVKFLKAKSAKKAPAKTAPSATALQKLGRQIKAVKTQAVAPIRGESIGRQVGGWVGDMAQKAIMAITGFGDYTVSSNTLVNGGSPPAFQRGKHMTKFCHREFVGLVFSPGGQFNVSAYPINPKSSRFFPWLSEMALSFEQYIIRGMVVEFKSTSATAIGSTNTALGSVIIATQYNVLAAPFSTQQQMEAYEYTTSCAPSQSMIHPIECASNLNSVSELYIDSANGDPRLEYLGTTYVATVGQQASSTIGELWVSYEIDLIRPKLFSGVASAGLTTHYVGLGDFMNGILPVDGMFNPTQVRFDGAANLVPVPGSDLPVFFPPNPNGDGNFNQLRFPGWLTGYFRVDVIMGYSVTAAGATISWSELGSASIISGSGSVPNNFLRCVASATAAVGTDRVSHTSAAADSQQIIYSTVLQMNGDQPQTPVVFALNPYSSPSASGTGYFLNSYSLMISQISVPPFP
jgi:hypothetical protein